ncbi:hypothetical protein G5I_06095 [Acromyrmex echinatior]|uniref:Uncharacterized protein n=1 Tax=Acromyrmex echinatior TaxID=103372 RepID=F4WK52_ACREC|nr:hypothetical protein G5I_06095 [Acromyrmex echinatior]
MEYETTSERRNEEGPRRWERDGARGSRFREPLNSRGPGLEAGFVVEPSRWERQGDVRNEGGGRREIGRRGPRVHRLYGEVMKYLGSAAPGTRMGMGMRTGSCCAFQADVEYRCRGHGGWHG